MPLRHDEEEAFEDEADLDPEGPDPHEMDSSDEPDLDVCPHCRKLISEETEQCPHCGQYLSLEQAPLSTPAWIVVGTLLALLVVLLVWIF